MMRDKKAQEYRPSHWHFFWYYFFFFLVIPPLVALIKRASLRVRVEKDHLYVERGLLAKDSSSVFYRDIRTVEVKQSIVQRIAGIGDVLVATSGTDGYEAELYGMPDALALRDRIVSRKKKAMKGEKTGD